MGNGPSGPPRPNTGVDSTGCCGSSSRLSTSLEANSGSSGPRRRRASARGALPVPSGNAWGRSRSSSSSACNSSKRAACGAAADSEGERRAGLGLPCLHLLVGFHQDRAHEAVGGGIQREELRQHGGEQHAAGADELRIESQADFQAIAPAAPGSRRAPPPAGSRVAAGLSAGGRWRRRAGVQGEDFPQGFEGARAFHQRVVEGQLRDQSPARLAVQARLALRAGRVAQACGGDRPAVRSPARCRHPGARPDSDWCIAARRSG